MVGFYTKSSKFCFLGFLMLVGVLSSSSLVAQKESVTALEKETEWNQDKEYPKGLLQTAVENMVDDEDANEAKDEDDKPQVSVGGALRFNYHYDTWRPDLKEQGGELIYDVFRINAKARWKGLFVNAEYRYYSQAFGGGYLKQGWIGYDFNDKNTIHLGLTQVPFGIQTYNSSCWFFNITYYVGLEDDHDVGLKYMHLVDKGLSWQVAFFKNAEYTGFGGASTPADGRYSYDVAGFYTDVNNDGVNDYQNMENNTLSGKLEYGFGETNHHKLGLSAMYGGVWNFQTKDFGNHWAAAAHYEGAFGNFKLKAQALRYVKNLAAPDGEREDIFAMTAYGFPYLVASEANILTAGISYSHDVDWGPVSNLTFYNDFGLMDKTNDAFEDSYMNTTGVLVTAGQLYTYIDFAQGKNHSWVGGNFVDDFAQGNPDAGWEMRFNINFGYYF